MKKLLNFLTKATCFVGWHRWKYYHKGERYCTDCGKEQYKAQGNWFNS